MIKWLYKRIIRKLNLSKDQLIELKSRLTKENICKGPFVQGEKNCPNTTALALKKGIDKFKKTDEVWGLMKNRGVRKIELWSFYVVFDIPAILSERFFEKALGIMKSAIDEIIYEKQKS